MKVLVTGAYGRCGTAIIDHLHDHQTYDFTYLNRSDRPEDHPYGRYETVLGDVSDFDTVCSAMEGHDAVVHLAAYPFTDGSWTDVHDPNITGMYNTLEAAREAAIEHFIFASTNHVVGMYEKTLQPELYENRAGVVVDHRSPVRPDSFYGASKAFGEFLGRYYIEEFSYPERFYALRICNVSHADEDNPGMFAKGLIEDGMDPESEEYIQKVRRKMAMWHSRRDFAHLIDCCLSDETVDFDIFYGVSDNLNRWFDLEHGRSVLGYRPQDRAEDQEIPGVTTPVNEN